MAADLESLVTEIKRFATAARRDHPIPVDFEATLRRFNLSVTSLKPHIRHALSGSELVPTFIDLPSMGRETIAVLPLLGEELSGKADRDAKPYIPASFPEFPSRHTYRFTPQDDTFSRDPKKTREEAAKVAQQGEDALRRLVRASKLRKQKEVKSLVEQDTHGKERFRLWEATMRRFMGVGSRGEHADEVEIADHSMIVNGDSVFLRREFPRGTKISGPGRI